MLSVETALHLRLKVRSPQVTVNGLLAALEQTAPELEARVFWEVVDRAQIDHLEAVRRQQRPSIRCRRCGNSTWVKRGSRVRKLKTSRGEFRFPLRQVSCRGCERTWSPLIEALGLRPWQRVSEELLERLVALGTEVSYRKASRWGDRLLTQTLAPMTIWRGVQERARQLAFTPMEFEPSILVLDGTQVPAGGKPRGEAINLAFEIGPRYRKAGRWGRQKRLVGLALGGPRSWSEVLPRELDPQLVVNDGESGIEDAIVSRYPGARLQRCEWHLLYSLRIFLWRDGLRKSAAAPFMAELRELLFESLRATRRRDAVASWVDRQLRWYRHSRTLLRGALRQICYPKPSALRTTSHAERAMRELNRRTDVGVRWSVSGVRNLLSLRLAQRYNPDDYARLWSHRSASGSCEVEVSMN